jgi:DNA repair protein RadC
MNAAETAVVESALAILDRHLKAKEAALESPAAVRAYLRLKLERRESEVFAVVFMDAKHRVIEYKELFFGTIDAASVYPREVVKAALSANAAAAILVHCHPSGDSYPSNADRVLTQKLKESLALVDVRVLDHLVVGQNEITSLAEMGWC